MTTHDWLWPGFLAFVAVVLFFDLFVLHRRDHVITTREAMKTVAGYVALAMVFAMGVFYFGGKDRGAEFLTGYLIDAGVFYPAQIAVMGIVSIALAMLMAGLRRRLLKRAGA